MNEHLIIYLDILGTKDAIGASDRAKTDALVELLNYLALHRGDANCSEWVDKDAALDITGIDINPAVSTFSDHIVISYPVKDLQQADTEDALGAGLYMSQMLIPRLAAAALKVGFLIRGGATVGLLHHQAGVVLGPAMIEAYELESRHAVYPRIAVSRKLYTRVKFEPRIRVLLTDHDGITHLNYFTEMILRSGEIEESRAVWLERAYQISRENIARFEHEERWNEMAKWVWFEKQLETARLNAAPLIR